MEDYLIKNVTNNFKFKQILASGYEINENVPVKLKEKTMGDGSIRVVYAQYTTTMIKITFGNMTGADIQECYNKFIDGTYLFWSKDLRNYKEANFIIEKPSATMINSLHGERYEDFTIILKKSSEV